MSMQDKVNEFMRLRQQGVSAREAYIQVFPNGIEQEIAREQADAQADAGMGQVAGLVGGALTAKGVGDVITGAPTILGMITNPFASTAAAGSGAVAPIATTAGAAPVASMSLPTATPLLPGAGAAGAGAGAAGAGAGAAATTGASTAGTLTAANPLVGSAVVAAPLVLGPLVEKGLKKITGWKPSVTKTPEAMAGSAVLAKQIPGWENMSQDERLSIVDQAQKAKLFSTAGTKQGKEMIPDNERFGPRLDNHTQFALTFNNDDYRKYAERKGLSAGKGYNNRLDVKGRQLVQNMSLDDLLNDPDAIESFGFLRKQQDKYRDFLNQMNQMPAQSGGEAPELQEQPLTTEMEGSSAMLGQRPIQSPQQLSGFFPLASSAAPGLGQGQPSFLPVLEEAQNYFSGPYPNPSLTIPQQIGIQDTAIRQGMAAMNEAQPLMPAQAAEAGAASMMPIQNFDLSNRFIDQNPYSLAALADNMRANLGQQQQSPVMAAMMQGFGEELEEERLRGLGFR